MTRGRKLAVDVTIALAAFAATLALLGHGSSRDLDALGVFLAACATWPLVAWRRSPLAVLVVTTLASSLLNGLDYALGPPFGPTIALFFVASQDQARAHVRTTAAVVLGLLAVHLGATGIAEDGFPLTPLLLAIVVWGGAWVAGDQVRQRRERLRRAEERAMRAERERERERQLAAAEERTRIARDLHDSAGHAINVILVQAGAGRLLQERDPTATRAALETIEDVARQTKRAVLSSDDTLTVVGEGADGRGSVDLVRALAPDVVLMDVRMPDLDGISATREILAVSPEVRVVIVTTFEQDDYIFGALRAGASGFLLKRTKPEELIEAIHTIAAGDSLLSPSVTRRVIEQMTEQPVPERAADQRLDELTPRERDVLELIARGLSNSEIASALVVEQSTVKTHVKRILMKLRLRDRVQAVIFAYESGLARPGPKPAA